MKKICLLSLILIALILLSGCVDTEPGYIEGRTFKTDVFSFDNNIIFIMNAKDIVVTDSYFDCWINGELINSTCYTVFYETNVTYAKKTIVVIHCDANGTPFSDGQLVQVSAMYSHPDWDYDYYNDLNICHSCMKINHGWYPYAC